MEKKVRVRFAPSPTGALHIGGVRTAIYNYIFARQQGGEMILRIEDTDQARLITGAEDYIYEALEWIGIQPDEGVNQGGLHSPYRQSERKEIYQEHVMQLVEAGHAYYAFDTPEELEAMRERLKAAGVVTPQYNAIARTTMKNSLTLPPKEVKARMDAGEPYVIRLKVPRKEEIRLNDMIRGWVMVHSTTLDDKVLLKSDGMPTYHLANVVDDHLMGITHVIRGEEWLPSAPTHVLLYQFFGWEDTMPQFAHLPLLLKPDGNGKLSKRDSQKHGFPIFPITWKDEDGATLTGFREAGYLPDALINFLVFLGWNPGTEQELFTLDELIREFSIERIHKAGVKFDIDKAQWYNQQYIKSKPDEELTAYLLPQLEKEGIQADMDKVTKICGLLKERVTFTQDFWLQGQYFFLAPEHYAPEIVQKKWTEEAVKALTVYTKELQNATDALTAEQAKTILQEVLEKLDIKMGKAMPALRLAITGVGGGPDLMEIISVIGRKETVQRIENAVKRLEDHVKV